MSSSAARERILSPLDRFSEIVFGLIMVLSFTGAVSVVESRAGLRTLLVSAIGCNLAWGIIDATFYLISSFTERCRHATMLHKVRQAGMAPEARRVIALAMPPAVAAALESDDFERIRKHLHQLPHPPAHSMLTREDWRGAVAVFLLVFFSTLPVVTPFLFIRDARLALRVSNGIAIAMLFGAGYRLARYAGIRPVRTGMAMVTIGLVLVGVTIGLGG